MPFSSSRRERILEIYAAYGGEMSPRRLAQYCREHGVWDATEWSHMALAAATRQCHEALRSKDGTGLPVAGPTQHLDEQDDDGPAPLWRQLRLWDYADATYNLALRTRQIDKDVQSLYALHDYVLKRWGMAPQLPQWVYDEEAPIWWLDGPTPDEGTPSMDDDPD